MAGVNKKRTELTCAYCDKQFWAKRTDTRYCPSCRPIVSLEINNRGRNDRRAEVNRQARERTKAFSPEQRLRRLENQRVRRWRDKYGITREIFNAMLTKQKSRCAICDEVFVEPHVDHCHKTNRVRALLCESCNLGLGLFKDNSAHLKHAASYIESYKG